MIGFLSGVVLEKTAHGILLETASGVGYEVTVTPRVVAELVTGSNIRLYTYLKVSDSAQELFGFSNTMARDFFKLLLTVSGIGPKSAMNILALGDSENIQAAITRGDVKYLTAIQGLGKKTAERLVVELKNKFTLNENHSDLVNGTTSSDALAEVVEGLVAMGYSQAEARDAVHTVSAAGKSPEALLREALAALAR